MFITQMIMRDVNNGWLIRYTHANVASFFFIFVYALNYKFIISNNLFYYNLSKQTIQLCKLTLSCYLKKLFQIILLKIMRSLDLFLNQYLNTKKTASMVCWIYGCRIIIHNTDTKMKV